MRSETREFSTCIKNVVFDAIHYTPISGVPTLHGHTFRVSVCAHGSNLREGWVIDFDVLRNVVRDIVSSLNYSVLVPAEDVKKVDLRGPFSIRVVEVDFIPTAENLALHICRELRRRLDVLKEAEIVVEVEEGADNVGIASC